MTSRVNIEYLENADRKFVLTMHDEIKKYVGEEGHVMHSGELAFNTDVLKLIDIIFKLNDRVQDEIWNGMGEAL